MFIIWFITIVRFTSINFQKQILKNSVVKSTIFFYIYIDMSATNKIIIYLNAEIVDWNI
jgi:hypothetical protein